MKSRAVLCWMLAFAAIVVVLSWIVKVPWGFGLMFASVMPCFSLIGGQKFWKPWFMANVQDDEFPDLRIIVIQAAILEAMTIVGLLLAVGPILIGFRMLGFLVQLSTLGKLSRDVGITPCPENEDRRTPTSRNRAGHAGQ